MSAEIVGPVASVYFGGGPRNPDDPWDRTAIAYVRPRDTMDPRFEACTDHHVACDCREAEFAENESEARYERKATQQAFEAVLAGHDTYATDDGRPGCLCTGCQIARQAHIWVYDAYSLPVGQ